MQAMHGRLTEPGTYQALQHFITNAPWKIGNCQVAVSSVLIGAQRVWPLPRDLYLPQEWVTDPVRQAEASMPEGTRFREKWRMALADVRTVLKVRVHSDRSASAGYTADARRAGIQAARIAAPRSTRAAPPMAGSAGPSISGTI